MIPKTLLLTRNILLFFILLCSCVFTKAQNCTPVFKKSYSGSGVDHSLFLLTTRDKGSIVAGTTTSSSVGDYDGFLMKLNESGVIEWTYNYGGSNYDEFTKVKGTSDGGYIALGFSKSFGNSNGEPFLVKISSTGITQWSKRITTNSNIQQTPKDIAVLHDGAFAILVNRNDSTPQSDGLIYKLSSTGALLWGKSFDNGGDDGFNTVAEEQDSLVVGGFAAGDLRDAVLMKISSVNGGVYWSQKYSYMSATHDEILNIEVIPGGLAFSATAFYPATNPNYATFRLAHFKRLSTGSFTYKGRSDVSSGYGSTPIKNVVSKYAADGGFIYFMNETAAMGASELVKLNQLGFTTFGTRLFEQYAQRERMTGLDTSVNKGFWVTGYQQAGWPETRERLYVFKLDRAGYAGTCVPYTNSDFTDTVNYTISNFAWSNISSVIPEVSDIAVVSKPNDIALYTNCDTVDCAAPVISTGGCNSTFLSFLQGPTRVELMDVQQTNDGGTIGVGSLLLTQPFIVKIAPDGTVAWSRTYGQFMSSMFFKRIIPTSDGNYLVIAINTYTADHQVSEHSKLLKINDSGDIIWAKDYDNGSDLQIYSVIETPDGGFIMTLTGAWGAGYTYSFLMRVDSNGNTIWKKESQHSGGSPVYKHLFLDKNSLYVLADNYLPNNRFRVEKWDATTGQMLWGNKFEKDSGNIAAGLISKVGDTVYVVLQNGVSVTWNSYHVNVIVCKFDTTGKYLSNYRLLTPNNTNNSFPNILTQHFPFFCYQMEDNNFVIAQQAQYPTGNALNVTKFTPAGNTLWSRTYSNLNRHYVTSVKGAGGNVLIGGRMEFNQLYGQQGYSSFILKTDVYGKIQESATGQCHSDSVGVAMDFDKGIKFGFDDFTGLKDDQWIKVRNSNLSKYDIVIQASLQCYVPSSCSNIQLIGADTICNINDAYTYRLERNPGCSIPSQWLFDTSYIQPITLTDSTITVRFKQAGLGYIKSVLSTGCGNINTRKNIKIFKAGNAFSLGPDTVLCPDNNILLNAHRGFASYEWNDGSTDSTYQIAQPGKYFVKVIDSCGNIFSDTLMVSPHPPIPFDVGVDRVKCNNDTLHIDAPSGFINYSWSPSYNISSLNAQKIVINPTKDTSYFVKAELIPGCFGYDTVRVKVNHSPSIYLGNDTSFCIGKSTVLDAGVGFSAYRWSDGSSLQTLTVNKTGSYSVIGTTTDGCSSYDTMRVVSVWPLPSPALDHNNELCQSSSRILDPGAFVSYLWQDGSTSRKYNASTTGNYYVQVTDNNGCVNADTVVITTILPPPFNFLPNDTSICSYGTADLKPTGTFTSFLWSNGSSTSKITVDKPGTYWLQVRDNNGCIGKDTVVVNPKDCMVGLRVPNGFTPNKDHKNDEFRAMLFGNVKLFELTVYNRWGQIVFFTTDRYKGWDGTVAGRDQDPGVFIWMCKYQLEGDQKRIERGTVTLVR